MIGSHTNRLAINHLKLFGLVISACLYFASVSIASAQERSGLGDESLKTQDELSPHMDSHVSNSAATSTNSNSSISREKEHYRDTVSVKPATVTGARNKPDSSTQKKAEEETLSFNVLYFIIQKFKVSEIMN